MTERIKFTDETIRLWLLRSYLEEPGTKHKTITAPAAGLRSRSDRPPIPTRGVSHYGRRPTFNDNQRLVGARPRWGGTPCGVSTVRRLQQTIPSSSRPVTTGLEEERRVSVPAPPHTITCSTYDTGSFANPSGTFVPVRHLRSRPFDRWTTSPGTPQRGVHHRHIHHNSAGLQHTSAAALLNRYNERCSHRCTYTPADEKGPVEGFGREPRQPDPVATTYKRSA